MQSWWWLIWPPDERHTRADLIISRSILSGYAVDLPVYCTTAWQGNPQLKCEKQGVGICEFGVTFDTSATQGRESDSDRALCQATLFDWHVMAPLFIVLLWVYICISGNATATKECPARVWTLEAPACPCQQTLLNWPVIATLLLRIGLIFGNLVLCASALAFLAILSFNWDYMKIRDR